jgi:hypothetical protein
MWATPKLIALFIHYGLCYQLPIQKPKNKNLIVLTKEVKVKNSKGKLVKRTINVPFRVNDKVRNIQENLERYNETINQHCITVNLSSNVEITYEYLLNNLYPSIVNNQSEIIYVKYNKNQITQPENQTLNREIMNHYQNTISLKQPIGIILNRKPFLLSTITHTLSHKGLVCVAYRDINPSAIWLFRDHLSQLKRAIVRGKENKEKRREYLETRLMLSDMNINLLVFTLEDESIYRVFNRGDKNFEHGGRAYGAQHQLLPRHLRHYIKIDNQETVEIDFSGQHMRMLYHEEGIDYTGDIYDVDGDGVLRKAYKKISLIAINADTKNTAVSTACHEMIEMLKEDKFKPREERSLPGNFNPKIVPELLAKFLDRHPLIEKYLCNDKGIKLQNKDSIIMNNILMSLLDHEIIGLPVFDSVIVQEQYRDLTIKIMEDEYENIMGFKPQLDIKKKPVNYEDARRLLPSKIPSQTHSEPVYWM